MATIGITMEGVCFFPGGRSGRVLRAGIEADGPAAEGEAPTIAGRLIDCYRENAPPDERFGEMTERMGKEAVFAAAVAHARCL